MGQPVVHFEIMGKDADKLREYYSTLFGWKFDTDNPMNYGVVSREDNLTPEGIGIGGGIGAAPEGYDGHVTFYVTVPERRGGARPGREPRRLADDGTGRDHGPHDPRHVQGPRGPRDRSDQPGRLTAAVVMSRLDPQAGAKA